MTVIIESSSSVYIRRHRSNYILFCDKIFGWWVLSGWGSEAICVCFPILVIDNFFCQNNTDEQSGCTKG